MVDNKISLLLTKDWSNVAITIFQIQVTLFHNTITKWMKESGLIAELYYEDVLKNTTQAK